MLQENQTAPDFTLPVFGGGDSHLYDRTGKTALLIFYKYNCPVCQLILPFLQKIYDAYGDAFYFVAIAQDGTEKTQGFCDEYSITIPVLMDMEPYPVSRQYGLESVPTLFLLDPDNRIRYAGEGFVKQDILNLSDILAEKSGRTQIDVFAHARVPEFTPG
jgi:peroxiredoxin